MSVVRSWASVIGNHSRAARGVIAAYHSLMCGWSHIFALIGVLMNPGAKAFTRSSGPHSMAIPLVRAPTPALLTW